MESLRKKFDAKVGKVLQLMIHSIYTNKSIFLRELISNASDACDKLKYYAAKNQNQQILQEKLQINVTVNKKEGKIIIEDNGIGMNAQDLEENLGTIASSGTQKFVEFLKGGGGSVANAATNSMHKSNEGVVGDREGGKDVGEGGVAKELGDVVQNDLIGQFGVGFYSAFMVAEKVTVYSRKFDEEQSYIWESEGSDDYEIRKSDQQYFKRGTRIELKIKNADLEYLDQYRVRHIISTYSDHIAFPIMFLYIEEDDGLNASSNQKQSNEAEQINKNNAALWRRMPAEIKAEEHRDFYQHLAQAPGEPWMILHNKVEGNIDYCNLLYIPGSPPFDLFNPDRKTRVKLYIKKVFITDDDIGLIPRYMRFLRGVIDSEDLPLNISRETLQYNDKVVKIKNSLIKRVLRSLKDKASKEGEEYRKFWQMFGEVLKEGLCEPGLSEKEELLDICRFKSLDDPDGLISLEDYVQKMVEGQKFIYYMTGQEAKVMQNNPQLEGFKKRSINVLLMEDNVDDFWLTVVHQYKNYELKPASSADVNLDDIMNLKKKSEDIKKEDAAALNKVDGVEDDKRIDEKKEGGIDDVVMIDYIKSVLNDRVKDVKISTKLINSPACIAIPEGGINIRMERMLLEQKQIKSRITKILEINLNHPILQRIKSSLDKSVSGEFVAKEDQKEFVDDLVELIFIEALLSAGEMIEDPHKAAAIVDKFVKLGLKSI